MSKTKLLNTFQLATLLAYFSIATVQATSHRIFCIYCAMTLIRPLVKSRHNFNKMAILLRCLMELVHC